MINEKQDIAYFLSFCIEQYKVAKSLTGNEAMTLLSGYSVLEYLEEHYGIQVDRDRYTVVYDAFASNLMPDVTVMENG